MMLHSMSPSFLLFLLGCLAVYWGLVPGAAFAQHKADEPAWASTEHGDLRIAPMQHAPFPHPSRQDGYTRRDTHYPASEHYQDASVAVLIPKGFKPSPSGTVDTIFYFHGHGNHVRQTLTEFELLQAVADSARPRVLIFPQGPRMAPDSSGGRLEEPGEAEALLDEVLTQVAIKLGQEVSPGRVTLSGHSGAYRVITRILAHGAMAGRVDEVLLLDATYGGLDALADWAATPPDEDDAPRRLRSVFTAHLADENTWLMAELHARDSRYLLTRNDLLKDDPKLQSRAKHANLLFVQTDESHNAARRWLTDWLAE